MPSEPVSRKPAARELDRLLRQVRRASIQVQDGGGARIPTIIQLAQYADEAPAWWSPRRDIYLRKFFPTEPYLCGAIYSVISRNASFRFEFTGPERAVQSAWKLVRTANIMRGWQSFALKISLDLLTQDNGAFFEAIRPARVRTKEGETRAVRTQDGWKAVGRRGKLHSLDGMEYEIKDSEFDLPIGVAHLDAARCTRTGDAEYPVVYEDTGGTAHKLRWYQVAVLEDMPSADVTKHDVGYCATSRALRLAQVLRDNQIHKHEKVSGRFSKRIYLTNVGADIITDAMEQANEAADARGLVRYMAPIIAETLEPGSTPAVATIDMASLPENFDEEATMRWYIAGLAVVFGVDYGFFAPLPGGKLGTSEQAAVQERQSRGKASSLWMKEIENKFNYHGILPRNVFMEFKEIDAQEEIERDTAAQRRAKTRQMRIGSGEITPQVARQIAVDQGDLDKRYLGMMREQDETPETDGTGETSERRVFNVGDGKRPRREVMEQPVESGDDAKTVKGLSRLGKWLNWPPESVEDTEVVQGKKK